MTRSEYLSIRGEKDFLFRYFIKEGGKAPNYPVFASQLATWLMLNGQDPHRGFLQIVDFLDKKFAQ